MVLFITQLQNISRVYLLKERWFAITILDRKFRFLDKTIYYRHESSVE